VCALCAQHPQETATLQHSRKSQVAGTPAHPKRQSQVQARARQDTRARVRECMRSKAGPRKANRLRTHLQDRPECKLRVKRAWCAHPCRLEGCHCEDANGPNWLGSTQLLTEQRTLLSMQASHHGKPPNPSKKGGFETPPTKTTRVSTHNLS
jgi:hypothetical protein